MEPRTDHAGGLARRLAILSITAVLAFAACSGGTSDPGGASGSAPASPSETGSAGTSPSASGEGGALQPPATAVQLTVWNPFTGPDGDFFTQIVDEFNAATPNVQVTVQTQPGAEYIQRLEAAASANQLPQVVAATYDTMPLLAEEGILTPIDDLVQQAGYDASMFPEAIWTAGQWKDQRMGIPIDTHPLVFFYNKALFEEAGLDPESPPTDQATFEAAIKAIQDNTDADGYQMVASGAGANFLVGVQFATLFYQGGGEWTNADYTEATFNSPAGVAAADYLARLVNDLGVPKVESDAEINAFQQGQNGMVWSGIWESTRYSEALGEDLGVAPVPQIFGEGVWGGSHNLAVTSAAPDGDLRQGAYYFIDWFSKNSLAWGAAGQIPARNDVREQVQGSDEGLLPIVAQVTPMAERVRFLPAIPGGGDLLFIGNGAGEATTFVINGSSSAQQALDSAATFNTQVLQENKQRYGF